jgi:hypothetical protein
VRSSFPENAENMCKSGGTIFKPVMSLANHRSGNWTTYDKQISITYLLMLSWFMMDWYYTLEVGNFTNLNCPSSIDFL